MWTNSMLFVSYGPWEHNKNDSDWKQFFDMGIYNMIAPMNVNKTDIL